MTDRSPYSDAGEDAARGPDRGSPPGIPRWVKVSAIIVGVLVLAVVAIVLFTGHDGEPGPGQHGLESGSGTQFEQEAAPAAVGQAPREAVDHR